LNVFSNAAPNDNEKNKAIAQAKSNVKNAVRITMYCNRRCRRQCVDKMSNGIDQKMMLPDSAACMPVTSAERDTTSETTTWHMAANLGMMKTHAAGERYTTRPAREPHAATGPRKTKSARQHTIPKKHINNALCVSNSGLAPQCTSMNVVSGPRVSLRNVSDEPNG